MKEEFAKKLISWVNKSTDQSFSVYVESRMEVLHKSLEMAASIEEVFKLQGQIKEVKRLLTLRDEVKKAVQGNKE